MTSIWAAHRELQLRLESEIEPAATSVDGRRFTFIAPVHHLEVRLGGYVAIGSGEGARLGQILDLGLQRVESATVELPQEDGLAISSRLVLRVVHGEGVILEGDGAPFADAPLHPAEPAEVRAWLERVAPQDAGLPVGELRFAPGERFALDAGGFNRHTFLCGQSGSGKTYALGVVLEQLLLETDLRMVVLDPNSDFVQLGVPRDDVDPGMAERYRAAAPVTVRSAGGEGDARLRIRLPELSPDAQAALLRLDPIADRGEYAEFAQMLEELRPETVDHFLESRQAAPDGMVTRIRNLGIDKLGVWSRAQGGSVLEDLRRDDVRCLDVDLGSLPTREEQVLVARAVLGDLWERRTERRPVLIVIDEAHNVCPAEPDGPLAAQVTDLVVRIAAEGRKFGLYLLIATQRPQKVPENVVTQCDNLILMRLNSAADTAYARSMFSFAPAGLIDSATGFRQGEALIAGKIASHPAAVRVGPRLSREGGADVPTDWATRVTG